MISPKSTHLDQDPVQSVSKINKFTKSSQKNCEHTDFPPNSFNHIRFADKPLRLSSKASVKPNLDSNSNSFGKSLFEHTQKPNACHFDIVYIARTISEQLIGCSKCASLTIWNLKELSSDSH